MNDAANARAPAPASGHPTAAPMRIVQMTPGAGAMYCGNCLRDNALVAALRKQGHHALMVPLYLPLTLDEEDQSAGTPIFFGGLNVYLEQKTAFFRKSPGWLHDLLASPTLLKWAAGKAAKTRAEDVGELTISMLRGEEGNQARELEELLNWLKAQPKPDVVCLSNALLVGLARRLKGGLETPVVCMLQGEEAFLDALPDAARALAWRTLAERAADADLFVAPSRWFADRMTSRLGLKPERVRVVPNGIRLDGYDTALTPAEPPTLGYLARMCREKGLDTLIEAYVLIRRHGRFPELKLRVAGSCGPTDEVFVNGLRERLKAAGLLEEVKFFPNLSRAEKLEFLRSLTVFSVPATSGEAFGLYVLEALASGVPVVQPRHGAFPELIEATGGGRLCEPDDPQSLAVAIESLLTDHLFATSVGTSGRRAVLEHFSHERMAHNMLAVFREVVGRRAPEPG